MRISDFDHLPRPFDLGTPVQLEDGRWGFTFTAAQSPVEYLVRAYPCWSADEARRALRLFVVTVGANLQTMLTLAPR